MQKWRDASPENRAKSRAAAAKWGRENKGRRLAYKKHRYATDEGTRKSVRNTKLKQKFGISLEERDALLVAQGGGCAVCTSKEPGATDWHTDHCHTTGITRGILCRACNLMLGFAQDDETRLVAAIGYLERYK